MLQRSKYEPIEPYWFPEVGLGLTLWEGVFEGVQATWLRWCDQEGRVIPTGAERADEERRRADEERRRADEERRRADEAAEKPNGSLPSCGRRELSRKPDTCRLAALYTV